MPLLFNESRADSFELTAAPLRPFPLTKLVKFCSVANGKQPKKKIPYGL
jgi:hypothetical protein